MGHFNTALLKECVQYILLLEGRTHRGHTRLQRVATSIATGQIHDEIVIGFPRLLILLQISGGNPGLVIWSHALPIDQHLSLGSAPFVFKLLGHMLTVGQAFDLLQLRLEETTLDFLAPPIFQVVVIDTVVQGMHPVCDRLHSS